MPYADPEKQRAYFKEYRAKNKQEIARKKREYQRAHPDVAKAWNAKNKEKVRQYDAKKRAKRPEWYERFVGACKRARNFGRYPAWADKEKLIEVYKNCPKELVVDHIIPLNGEKVSGLHVHNNLQYLTNSENGRKGNSYGI